MKMKKQNNLCCKYTFTFCKYILLTVREEKKGTYIYIIIKKNLPFYWKLCLFEIY